jgi:hypothetical membrane protein
MDERRYALFGLIGPLVAFFFIALSIGLSPWFSWQDNALSDLGHATNSSVAPLFNFGLLVAGFFVTIYSVTVLRTHARYTSLCLLASALLLQLVAAFDETYGSLHFLVSVLLFVSFGFASAAYAVEKKPFLALSALVIGFCSWAFYFAGIYGGGIAIPETISSVAAVSWVASSALRTLRRKRT